MSGLPAPIHVSSSGSRSSRSNSTSSLGVATGSSSSNSSNSASSTNPNNINNTGAVSPAVQHSSLHTSRMGVGVSPNLMAQYGSFNGYRMQQQVSRYIIIFVILSDLISAHT